MKQGYIKILKNRILCLRKRNLYILTYLQRSLIVSKNIYLNKIYYIYFPGNKTKFWGKHKKICSSSGKFKSVNKKINFNRSVINKFLIENSLSFYKSK